MSTTTLHLGENDDEHYDNRSGITPFDVGKILESKYGIYSAFWRKHGPDVGSSMAQDVERAVNTGFRTGKIPEIVFLTSANDAMKLFHNFLSLREVETMGLPGVPTAAALAGVRHRKGRRKMRHGSRRPSFIDSGLLEANFRAWFTV